MVSIGAKWLEKQGFPIVFTELQSIGCREQADVVAFRSSCSAIIEAKTSRSDFLVDARKPERQVDGLGLGVYRYYLCPAGLIMPADLPLRWGLLHEVDGKVIQVAGPTGNYWPSFGTELPGWSDFQHQSNISSERSALFSIARRLSKSSN